MKKIVLLGESGCGKTSIVVQHLSGLFNEYSEPTIGAAYSTCHHKGVKMELWDTAGQERYSCLAPLYYRGAHCAIIIFDLTRPRESVDMAQKWIRTMKREGVPFVIAGNKADIVSRTIVDFESTDYLDYIDVSAKSGYNITELFDKVVDKCLDNEKSREKGISVSIDNELYSLSKGGWGTFC